MVALPPAAHVLKVQLKWTVGVDVSCFNVLHFNYAGSAPNNTDCNNIATAVDAGVAAGLTLSQHPTTILTEVLVTDLTSPTSGFGTHVGTRAGTAGGGPLPANTAVLVNYAIQRRYRGGKPRSYFPMGTDTDLQDAQTWTSAAQTNFYNHFQASLAAWFAITWPGGNITGLVSLSYVESHTWSQNNPPNGPWKSHPVYRATPIADPITASSVNKSVGTQRRRVRGKRT